jgi:hypothetical protein
VLPAKLYYLKQLENGPLSHRTITKRMTGKYLDSAARIKDALVADGIIVCVKKVLQSDGKYNYHHELTGKVNVVEMQQENFDVWDDGSARSTGNAFDWRGPSIVFSRQELAHLQQKYQNNNPITIYSRA